MIIARTDAIAVEGFDAALDRAEAYLEAGADVLFIEARKSADDMAAITTQFAGRVPLLANMVEGWQTPSAVRRELESKGFSIAIFPGGIVRALAHAGQDYYQSLAQTRDNRTFRDRMFDFNGLNNVIGTSTDAEAGRAL